MPVAELKQVIESLAPKVAPPPAQVLPEAAAHQLRAENMRMQAEIQATLEAHQLEMKKHAAAAESAARLAEIHQQTPHQQVVEKIIEKHHAPVTNIYDQRTTYNDGRDARQVIDNSQTLNIDARTQQEFLTQHNTSVAQYAVQHKLTIMQAFRQMFNFGEMPQRTIGQGGRHEVDIIRRDMPEALVSGGDDRPPPAPLGLVL